jgi:RNA polymerase sigma factor (sigma-70 family)
MSFPTTRQTLIERLAASSAEDDWRQFMIDYWRPVCRFAVHWGKLNVEDAEDVASMTFQALVEGDLLSRWTQNRSAKLRTLLCSVVRNVLSNRARVLSGRARLEQENRDAILKLASVQTADGAETVREQDDAFYAAWVDELLQDSIESLLTEYLQEGRGDYFRVFYGRLCERMTGAEVAESLQLTTTTAENYFRHAKQRFGETLKQLVERRLRRYANDDRFAAEFQSEWNDLSEYLSGRGGIERALRESYEQFDSTDLRRREGQSVTTILGRFADKLER